MNLPDYNKYIKLKDDIDIDVTHKTTQFTANQIAKIFYLYCHIVDEHEHYDKAKQWIDFTFKDKTNSSFKLKYYVVTVSDNAYPGCDLFDKIYTNIWNNSVTKEELMELNNIYKKYVLKYGELDL
jgi:hypothetical protein